MSSDPEIRSSADALRCLYLARICERAGRDQAAQRWYAKATEWLDRNLPSNRDVDPTGTEAADCQDSDDRTTGQED